MTKSQSVTSPSEMPEIVDIPYEPTPDQIEYEEHLREYCEAHEAEIQRDYDKYYCMLPDFEV